MKKSLEVLEKIYLNPGIHLREIARKVKLGIPAVKNHLDKFLKEKIITKRREGKNVKFFINFKNKKIISYLTQVEFYRLEKLPRFVSNVAFDLLSMLETKPLIVLIFGSYAKGDYTKESDLDVLLVFNTISDKVRKEIETKVKIVNSRYSVRVRPIYISWKEFARNFFDEKNDFMKEVKENKIIVSGIEHWVMLENEKA